MSPGTEELLSQAQPFRRGGGASGFADVERATSCATQLAALGGLSVAAASAEFARLLALGGTSVYVQITAPTAGATLEVVHHDAPRATLCVPQAFCCGAGQRATDPPDRAYVMVLWCQNITEQCFEAACPNTVRRITIVANGRLNAVDPEKLPLPLDLVTA
jgi:hypothetical protein